MYKRISPSNRSEHHPKPKFTIHQCIFIFGYVFILKIYMLSGQFLVVTCLIMAKNGNSYSAVLVLCQIQCQVFYFLFYFTQPKILQCRFYCLTVWWKCISESLRFVQVYSMSKESWYKPDFFPPQHEATSYHHKLFLIR